MNIQHITDLAQQLQNEMPFISGINSEQENEAALELMNELTDDYDNNLLLIDVLWAKIEDYENNSPELAEFNQGIENLNSGSSMLRLLMDQHKLLNKLDQIFLLPLQLHGVLFEPRIL